MLGDRLVETTCVRSQNHFVDKTWNASACLANVAFGVPALRPRTMMTNPKPVILAKKPTAEVAPPNEVTYGTRIIPLADQNMSGSVVIVRPYKEKYACMAMS